MSKHANHRPRMPKTPLQKFRVAHDVHLLALDTLDDMGHLIDSKSISVPNYPLNLIKDGEIIGTVCIKQIRNTLVGAIMVKPNIRARGLYPSVIGAELKNSGTASLNWILITGVELVENKPSSDSSLMPLSKLSKWSRKK